MFLMPRKCPSCKKTFNLKKYNKDIVESLWQKNPYFPFCGKRCKAIDLLGWLSEDGVSLEDITNEAMGNT